MKRTRFLVTSLLAAGFGVVDEAHATFTRATTTGGDDDPNRKGLLRIFKLDHRFTLANHSSHSSHASHSSGYSGGHSSHASHSSGYGTGSPVYTYPTTPTYNPPTPAPAPVPAPAYRPRSLYATPPAPTSPSPTTPLAAAPQTLRGGTERFTSIVRRVQLGLLAYGYYEGAIDGVVGASMKASLRRFQTDFKLPVTGTITPQTLDALRITAE